MLDSHIRIIRLYNKCIDGEEYQDFLRHERGTPARQNTAILLPRLEGFCRKS